MKTVSDLIIAEKDTASVFVFPSEAAASNWRKDYLRLTGVKAVRNSRFLSWDRFKESITLHNRTDKPVNSVIRRMFSSDLAEKNSRSQFFTKLIPQEYSKLSASFTDSLMRIIPELHRFINMLDVDTVSVGAELSADYRKLYHEYTRFMKEK